MGRGNICTHHECEGLYYLDRDLLDVYRPVIRCECGDVIGFDWIGESKTARQLATEGVKYAFDGPNADWHYSAGESAVTWSMMIDFMRDYISRKFQSFSVVENQRWRGDFQLVLENAYFHIALADNEWSAAWCLLERCDVDDEGSNRALMRRHYSTYLESIKNALLEGWGEAVAYGGAWVSGQVYRKGATE